MDLFARSVAAVLDHADIDRAVLVGHSNGTPVIRQFYRLFPERTAALVVVDGTLKRMFDQSMVDGMIAQLSEDKYQQFVGSMIDSMRSPGLADETTTEIRSMASEVPHHAVVGNFLAGADPEIWTEDPIDAPLLAVLARQPAWNDDYEAFVRGLAPQVDYHILDDISHFLMMERPQDFDRLLIDFLENNALLSSTEQTGGQVK